MLDAYAVRKAIPRLVLAVIGINLSIYLCIAALDITMIVGNGLNKLLVGPFLEPDSFKGIKIEGNVENTILGVLGMGSVIGGAFVAIFATAGIAGTAAISLLGFMLPLIITVSLISLAVLFTLVIRQGLLVFLTVISPIAIACYVLPGTEKYFKQWADLFMRTLLVYPIIAAIFAMSNVLGAILLNSAGGAAGVMVSNINKLAQGTSDSIAVVQIIAAIVVLYAPLLLIPFAFKLAGGAISAVMNAANGRATSIAGRAGQAINRNRQDPTSFLGSRKAKAFETRQGRGLTGDSVLTGLSGGVGSRMRGGRFRTGYAAAVGDRNEALAFKASDRLMEDHDYKYVSGNDDALYALQHGKSAADVSAILRRRGVTDERENAETTAAVMRARGKGGERAIQLATARSQAKTGTAHVEEYDFYRSLAEASGGNKNVLGRLVAEARGSAIQSGRGDLGGSSFNDSFTVASKILDSMEGGKGYSREEANSDIRKSVVEGQAAGTLLHASMKPVAARNYGKAWQQKVQRMQADMLAGKATEADFKRTMAQAAGAYEAMNASSPQNAKEFANQFMGTGIDTRTLSVGLQDKLATTIENGGGNEILTMAQVVQGLRGDVDFQTMRREYQDAMEASRGSGAATAATTVAGTNPADQPGGGTPGVL